MNDLMKAFQQILIEQHFLRQMTSTVFEWYQQNRLYRKFKIEKDRVVILQYAKNSLDNTATDLMTPEALRNYFRPKK